MKNEFIKIKVEKALDELRANRPILAYIHLKELHNFLEDDLNPKKGRR